MRDCTSLPQLINNSHHEVTLLFVLYSPIFYKNPPFLSSFWRWTSFVPFLLSLSIIKIKRLTAERYPPPDKYDVQLCIFISLSSSSVASYHFLYQVSAFLHGFLIISITHLVQSDFYNLWMTSWHFPMWFSIAGLLLKFQLS